MCTFVINIQEETLNKDTNLCPSLDYVACYKCQIKIFGFENTHVEAIDNLHQYHRNIIQVH